MSSLLNKTWVFRTEFQTEEGAKDRTGGAICISRNGLILTVAHNLEIPKVLRKRCVFYVRARDDTEFREVKLIAESKNFDLALLEVKKIKEGEEFDFYSLQEDGVEVKINEDIIAYLHQNNHLFTEKQGITCYPFPKNYSNQFPDVSDETTLKSSGFPDRSLWTDREYKTLDCVADSWDSEFMDMHPKLPLIQVAGFDDDPGASGCPFFKINTGTLIGLASFAKDDFQYLLPVDLLKAFVNRHAQLDGSDYHVRQYYPDPDSDSDSDSASTSE